MGKKGMKIKRPKWKRMAQRLKEQLMAERFGKKRSKAEDEYINAAQPVSPGKVMRADEGKTYGQRALVGKAKSFKIGRANLIEMLDDAFNAGHAECGKWATGVQADLRHKLKEADAEIRKRFGNAKIYRCAAELLMEKYGWKPEGRQ